MAKPLYKNHITKSVILAQAMMVLPQQSPDIEIQNFSLIETKDNWQNLELKAKRAGVYKVQNLIGITQPKFQFWNQSGNNTKINGDDGIIESKSGDIEINGSTTIESDGGLIINTDSLSYFAEAQSVKTQSLVQGKLNSGGKEMLNMSGLGLEADLRLQGYKILKDVRANQNQGKNSFIISSEQGIIYPIQSRAQFNENAMITADSLSLSGDQALLIMNGDGAGQNTGIEGIEMSSLSSKLVNAKVSSFDVQSKGFKASFNSKGELTNSTATGSARATTESGVKMSADELTMTPNGDHSFLVDMKKGVKIIMGERIAKCESAVYNTETGEILLENFASVTKGTQELNGERIRLSTENSQVNVEKASGTMKSKSLSKSENE